MTDTVIPSVGKDARTLIGDDGTKQADLPYAFQHLDPQALFAMANVMHEGAQKYGHPAENWRRIPVEDHLNHMISHAYAWLAGDRSDDHLSHMACRAMGALQVSLQQAPPVVDHKKFEAAREFVKQWFKDNPCPTCQSGDTRMTVGMVCRTCGRDYSSGEAGVIGSSKNHIDLAPEMLNGMTGGWVSDEVQKDIDATTVNAGQPKGGEDYHCNPDACPGDSCVLDHPKVDLNRQGEIRFAPRQRGGIPIEGGPFCPVCSTLMELHWLNQTMPIEKQSTLEYFCPDGHGRMVFNKAGM